MMIYISARLSNFPSNTVSIYRKRTNKIITEIKLRIYVLEQYRCGRDEMEGRK